MQRICVAVASRNRPKMVERALRSLIRLRIPKDSDVTILVVENGCDQLRDMVDLLTRSQPIPIVYRSEPQIGIASARNCALQYALDGRFDALAFIDDDEIASVEWLEQIVEEMRRSKAPLVGGPVRPIFAGVPPDWLTRIMWQGYVRRERRKEARAMLHKQAGRGEKVVVVTNNWLLDLAFCRKHNLSFDTSLNLSGHEDTAFYRSVRSAGGISAWAPDAVVEEEITDTRLSVSYQFARALNSTNTSLGLRFRDRGGIGMSFGAVATILVKGLVGTAMLILAPLTLGHTLLDAVRYLGMASGAVTFLAGSRTTLYAKTTGA